jgi:hypothetical protein
MPSGPLKRVCENRKKNSRSLHYPQGLAILIIAAMLRSTSSFLVAQLDTLMRNFFIADLR